MWSLSFCWEKMERRTAILLRQMSSGIKNIRNVKIKCVGLDFRNEEVRFEWTVENIECVRFVFIMKTTWFSKAFFRTCTHTVLRMEEVPGRVWRSKVPGKAPTQRQELRRQLIVQFSRNADFIVIVACLPGRLFGDLLWICVCSCVFLGVGSLDRTIGWGHERSMERSGVVSNSVKDSLRTSSRSFLRNEGFLVERKQFSRFWGWQMAALSVRIFFVQQT